jgi:hypothetical protein
MFYNIHLLKIEADNFKGNLDKDNILRRVTFFLAKYFKETADLDECESIFFVEGQYLCTVDVSFLESRLSSITNACKAAAILKCPTHFRNIEVRNFT